MRYLFKVFSACHFSPDRLPHYERVFNQTVRDQIDRHSDLPAHPYSEVVANGEDLVLPPNNVVKEKLKNRLENFKLLNRSTTTGLCNPVRCNVDL